MDQFITIKKQKISELFEHQKIYNTLLKYVNNKDIICLYGNSGIGKTFLVKQIFKNSKVTEIPHDILRTKGETLDFLEKIQNTTSNILIDDIEKDYTGWKELTELIKTKGRLNKGSIIIISKGIQKIDFCDCIYMEPYSINTLIKLGQDISDRYTVEFLKTKAEKCRGNIRVFLYSLDFDGERDLLLTPKDVIHKLLSPSELSPSSYIGKVVEEHGYSWGIVHENYVDVKKMSIEDAAKIANSMSIADIYDATIYKGDWDFIPYFCHDAIVVPTIKIKQLLLRESLRPGSAWTKYNNMKMRASKLKQIKYRKAGVDLSVDSLILIKNYCIKLEMNVIPLLKSYNLKYGDLDVINHLAFERKIKPKLLNNLKKELKKDEAS